MKKLLILLILPISIIGQETESDTTWEETIKWIDSKLDSGFLKDTHIEYLNEAKGILKQDYNSITNGILIIDFELDSYEGREIKASILTFYKCDLKKLIGIEANENNLTLIFNNGAVKGEQTIYVGGRSIENRDLGSELKLHFLNSEITKRMHKAFEHLIGLNISGEKF